MTNFIKKILFTFFSVRNFKFLILTFVFSYFALAPTFLPVLAQTATPVPLVSTEVESTSNPCSLYKDYNWGYSIKKINGKNFSSPGINGLYPHVDEGSFNVAPQLDQIQKSQIIAEQFTKDPLYLTTDNNITREDPILGVLTGKLASSSTSQISINSNVILLPCVITGYLSGLIPRRNDATTNYTNCEREKASDGLGTIVGNYVSTVVNSSTSHCASDNLIVGEGLGGCTLDYLFTDSPSANIQEGNVDGFNGDRLKQAQKESLVRTIYTTGTMLKKTDMSSATMQKMKQAIINYSSKFTDNLTLNSDFKPSATDLFLSPQNIVYYTGGTLDKNTFFYSGGNTLGKWYTNREVGSTEVPTVYTYRNDVNVINNIDKTSFICKKRTLLASQTGLSTDKILFEWIPSNFTQIRIPSCESFGPNASKVIQLPSAVNGKTTLVCTPCTVPTLFQSDLFGQPVRGIPTSLGCFPSSLEGNITALLRIASMMAGGIAALIITISGIRITLNSGNPEEIKKAQKGISSAIVGLLVIISSVLLLNLIGVKLLDLGSFGGNTVEFVTTGKG